MNSHIDVMDFLCAYVAKRSEKVSFDGMRERAKEIEREKNREKQREREKLIHR